MRKKLTRKQWIGAVLALLLFILITLFLFRIFHEDNRFEAFTTQFFLEELCSNPIHLHYSLADASAYGIEENSLTLPVYHAKQAAADLDKTDQTIAALSTFHPDKLSNENQYAYVLLSSYLETYRECASYLYFEEPLSPSSGLQSELPILLAEYRIASREDIENYLSILSQIPAYLEGIALYEQEKAEHGLFMSDAAADKVIKQCSMLMNPEQMESGEHFLVVTFQNRLEKLIEKQLISDAEALAWQSENIRLLTTLAAPAYDKLADELTLLKGSGVNTQGLCYFPNGQNYYEAYLHLTTGSYRSIAEIKTMLSKDFGNNYTALMTLLHEYPDLYHTASDTSASDTASPSCTTTTALTTMQPADMIEKLKVQMQQEYPAIPYLTKEAEECTIKYVDASLEDYTAPAFYLISPIDDARNNTIYINQKSTGDGLSLFTTLAHEGYPGHLYQTVYSRNYLQAHHANPIRSLVHYGGYIEGWALYCELRSYDYAAALSDTDGVSDTAAISDTAAVSDTAVFYQMQKLDRQIQLCLYSLLDISIHYEGASYEQVETLLTSIGFDKQAAKLIYDYIVEEPGNYLKYYLGYLEIMALKNQTETVWGDAFSLYRFHSFLLNNGPADFQTLSSLVLLSAPEYQSSFKLDKKN